MENNIDPVDRAMASLGSREWPAGAGNAQLENMLMREFHANTSASFVARHRVLVPVVAILVLGCAGFAAAGGVEFVRSLFLTVEINGNVVHSGDVVLDENGEGKLTLPEGSLPTDGDGEMTVTIMGMEAQDVPAEGAEMVKTISITGEGREMTVRVGSQPKGGSDEATAQTEKEDKPQDGGE